MSDELKKLFYTPHLFVDDTTVTICRNRDCWADKSEEEKEITDCPKLPTMTGLAAWLPTQYMMGTMGMIYPSHTATVQIHDAQSPAADIGSEPKSESSQNLPSIVQSPPSKRGWLSPKQLVSGLYRGCRKLLRLGA